MVRCEETLLAFVRRCRCSHVVLATSLYFTVSGSIFSCATRPNFFIAEPATILRAETQRLVLCSIVCLPHSFYFLTFTFLHFFSILHRTPYTFLTFYPFRYFFTSHASFLSFVFPFYLFFFHFLPLVIWFHFHYPCPFYFSSFFVTSFSTSISQFFLSPLFSFIIMASCLPGL